MKKINMLHYVANSLTNNTNTNCNELKNDYVNNQIIISIDNIKSWHQNYDTQNLTIDDNLTQKQNTNFIFTDTVHCYSNGTCIYNKDTDVIFDKIKSLLLVTYTHNNNNNVISTKTNRTTFHRFNRFPNPHLELVFLL